MEVAAVPDDDHSRTIIHIDIDCFYAQIEELKNPNLKNKPVGIQQKNIIVTCNYKARELGVKKLMLLKDATSICPNLVLVNGEDLHDYRQYSNQIHNVLLKFTPKVEKLGLDENFIDVTELVTARSDNLCVTGHVYNGLYEECLCGCHERIIIGSRIAAEMREQIKTEIGLTSCAGISYNKLLSKLIGSKHKPNQQTVLFSVGVADLILNLKLQDIPGIGTKMKQTLNNLGISTIKQLQEYNLEITNLDEKTKNNLRNWSRGIDPSPVKTNSRPICIGLEDSFKKICLRDEVRENFKVLLVRLMTLVNEDGRLPTTVKLTVRKYDNIKKIGHRESRQCTVPSSLFNNDNIGQLSNEASEKLLNIIMNLFYKMVDTSKPFHLTLLGLSFTKFQEKISGNKSIANFFIKKRDISVQSPTNFISDESISESQSPNRLNLSSFSPPQGISNEDSEPSSKRTKFDVWFRKRKREDELGSPSKLKVSELSLDCTDNNYLPSSSGLQRLNITENGHSNTSNGFECPSNIDLNVFKELPNHIQQELYQEWNITKKPTPSKQSLILKYCISNK